MLDIEGIVKISDFGLAYQEKKERDDESKDSLSIKPINLFAGTLPYMAPEIFQSNEVQKSSTKGK